MQSSAETSTSDTLAAVSERQATPRSRDQLDRATVPVNSSIIGVTRIVIQECSTTNSQTHTHMHIPNTLRLAALDVMFPALFVTTHTNAVPLSASETS